MSDAPVSFVNKIAVHIILKCFVFFLTTTLTTIVLLKRIKILAGILISDIESCNDTFLKDIMMLATK